MKFNRVKPIFGKEDHSLHGIDHGPPIDFDEFILLDDIDNIPVIGKIAVHQPDNQ
jgi:hypothetical protein